MKVYLLQGEHPAVPGNPLQIFATPAAAAAEALSMVNTIRAWPFYGPGGEDVTLPPLDAGSDWKAGLREYQRASLAGEGAHTEAEIAEMDDDGLADDAECAVWIIALDLEGVPEAPAALVELSEAGQAANEFLFDANEPAATAAAQRLADALQMMRWAAIWKEVPAVDIGAGKGLKAERISAGGDQ